MRVLIFSEKILSRPMPCALSASSCDCSSWVRCEQRAYPIRMSVPGVSETGGVGGGVPGLARAAACGGRHAQELGEAGNLLEPAGVVDRGDGAAARSAGRAGLDLAARA